MRPPEFTGGNMGGRLPAHARLDHVRSFNEAAGIHRRKRASAPAGTMLAMHSSEASMRPPEFTGGNDALQWVPEHRSESDRASMRPPEFTGGNSFRSCSGRSLYKLQ